MFFPLIFSMLVQIVSHYEGCLTVDKFYFLLTVWQHFNFIKSHLFDVHISCVMRILLRKLLPEPIF